MCVYMRECLCNKHMYVSAQVVDPSVWNFKKYLFNDLDYIFHLYLILEVYILFRPSYLIQVLIYTGFFNFYSIYLNF